MGEPSRKERAAGEPERVAWNEWEPATFARAARERKLVFLDISATWCHWCHVLDRTSLSDPRIVRLLNGSFVPIRVDTDRRPDVNDRYNQGGWPTTAVLLPDGQLLTGATYLPADELYAVLRKCADFFERERETVDRYMEQPSGPDAFSAVPEIAPQPRPPRPEDLSVVKKAVLEQYDPAHPGFFREPKFLHADALALLRDSWVLEADREMGALFQGILRTMAASGVADAVEGGFFRYATKRDWSVPHYEKLLSDNAEMLCLYSAASASSGDPVFARAAEGILRFLFSRLYDRSAGAFHASRDADEEYYALPPAERARRSPPAADRTVFSEHNAKAVSALVAAHGAPGIRGAAAAGPGGSLLSVAERLADFLHAAMWNPDDGQLRYAEEGAARAGHLADNAAAAVARLDLFDATGGPAHLARAGEVLDWTVRHLYSAKACGFLDLRPGDGGAGPQTVPLVPFAENARMAGALIRHARAAGRTDLLAVGEEVLKGLSGEFGRRGFFAAPYGSALLVHRKGR